MFHIFIFNFTIVFVFEAILLINRIKLYRSYLKCTLLIYIFSSDYIHTVSHKLVLGFAFLSFVSLSCLHVGPLNFLSIKSRALSIPTISSVKLFMYTVFEHFLKITFSFVCTIFECISFWRYFHYPLRYILYTSHVTV